MREVLFSEILPTEEFCLCTNERVFYGVKMVPVESKDREILNAIILRDQHDHRPHDAGTAISVKSDQKVLIKE